MKGNNRQRYLTEAQLSQLIKAARKSRYGQRDGTLILIMSRHGLRVTEAVDLRSLRGAEAASNHLLASSGQEACLGLQPVADDASALLAISRPCLGQAVVGHVVALDAERVLDDLGGAVTPLIGPRS